MDRATWDAAQQIGAEHGTSRDGDRPVPPPRRDPDLRLPGPDPLPGLPPPHGRPAPTARGPPHVYYQCPHNPANPRHAAAYPDHPRTVKAPETRLDQIVALFFADHVFGPGRAELLAAQLPATDAAAAADRDAQAAALTARLKQIDTAQNAQILALEQLPADPADTAAAAMRTRISARFAELHADREQAETQLAALAASTPKAADTTLLDQLPLAGDILPGLPPDLKARAVRTPSTCRSCGTSPASRPPSSPRSPKPPCGPYPASWTPARTDTMTQSMTSPVTHQRWRI